MKKIRWSIFVLIIIFASIAFLWMIKTPLIASYLTKTMGIDVSIESIHIRPSRTTIGGFAIRNPSGFRDKYAFKAENTTVDYQFKRLRKDPTEIDKIELDDVYLNIEFSNPLGTSNNWTEIASRVPTVEDSDVIIHHLVLNNITIETRGMGLTNTTKKTIPQMEFHEIDSREGFPTKELIREIFSNAGLMEYVKDVINPTKTLKKILNPLRSSVDEEGETGAI